MIDWIVAERIARFVAGTGDARPPNADLAALAAESEKRVVAYTGLQPARPLPAAGGDQPRASGSRATSPRCGRCSTRCSRAPARALARCARRCEIGIGIVLSTEVGVVLGYLAQRVLGQYELVLLDEAVEDRPPRLLFVLPNLGAGGAVVRRRRAGVHDVGGAPRGHPRGAVRRRAVAARARRRARARSCCSRPRCGSIPPASCGCRPRRSSAGSAGRCASGDLISIVTSKAERETLDRVQAVMAVIEGHAEHVMDAVAPDLLPSLPQAARGAGPAPALAVGPVAAGSRGCSGWS